MSKLIRGALLATLLYALPRCGGTSPEATEEPGVPNAGQSTGGSQAGDAGSKAGGSGGTGDLAHAGSASGGEAGTSQVGGAAGVGAGAGAGAAGAAGAVGAGGTVSGIGCGATCGPNEYCRAPCSGTGFGFGGTTGLPMTPPLPSCAPLPAACNGTPTCDCICGPALGFTFWCGTGSKPIAPGPAVQCGCA